MIGSECTSQSSRDGFQQRDILNIDEKCTIGIVIAKLISIGCLLLASAVAQHPVEQPAWGSIYGVVINQAGQPARGIRLKAMPLGVLLATVLPETKTDYDGKFRFANIPWWGRYTVFADDLEAGYSPYATRPKDSERLHEVVISPEHAEAEFNFRLPPQAGFLHFHLKNSGTGETIYGIEVDVRSAEKPDQNLFGIGTSSDRPILVPSDRDLLLHVTSRGFKEWSESIGRGKAIRVPPGVHIKLEVQLEPSP